ncbi:MAG: FecR domain-containing protein [Bacteroidales bacterium]|jgi:ferric-dicitrate binding protein FerR (iron transport regulator)
METDHTYPIDLITLYLAGEAGGDDLVFLESWLKADPGNRKIFEDYRQTWLEMEKIRVDKDLETDKEWNELQQKLFFEEKPKQGRIISFYYNKMLRVAAIILLLVVPSIFLIWHFIRPEQKQLDASLAIKAGQLPDGTSVTLNKGTTLEYPAVFRGNKRNITLKGEAFFEVKHDESKPFIVNNRNVRVEVLGTSFYVNTNAPNNTIEVVLNSGSVAVYFDDNKKNCLFLSPGEKAEINPDQEKMSKDVNTDPNYRSWMTHHFIYNNEPLAVIIADLNKVYHSNLRIITPSTSKCLVTATFDHQSLESVLHVLKATLYLNINDHGSWIEISGKNCN